MSKKKLTKSKIRKLVREEIQNIIQEKDKGVLYSYVGDVNIYDLTRSRGGGGTGPSMSGSNVVALEFGNNRVELNPNEAKKLFQAIETIYRNRK